LHQLAHQNLTICQGFLDDEGITAVVGEGIGERKGFKGALLEVKVASCTYGGAEFAEGDR